MLEPSPSILISVAASGDRFKDFAPYVPSISDDGAIAFQATLPDGSSRAFVSREGTLSQLPLPPRAFVTSHPDLNDHSHACLYASDSTAPPSLFTLSGPHARRAAPNAGPLGPTMNAQGSVAFRCTDEHDRPSIAIGRDGATFFIATTGPEFAAFQGLPVIDDDDHVLFRADRPDGSAAIMLHDGSHLRTIARSGDEFAALAAFPAMHHAACIVFAATLPKGRPGIFASIDGSIRTVLDVDAFESYRGALVDAQRRVTFIATPRGGTLGLYSGPDPLAHRILGLDSPLFDSTIAEFALNPVSINARGDLAIRVRLADATQHILLARRVP